MSLQPDVRVDADLAIAGSGFAGSILALVLRQRGFRVVLVDRGRHPRFAIGESSTPLAGLLIEELADRYDLPRLRPFSKWGTWRAAYPGVACGLKRGFSFFRHEAGQPFSDTASHARQLLVAASPHDGIADTHWYRPDFDHWLVREAESAGVVCLDDTDLERPRFEGDRVRIAGVRHGRAIHIDAGFLVDASGPRGYLWRTLGLGDARLEWLPPTQALYTHFEGVERWASVAPPDSEPPFPVDAAAVHHVLPGGWVWVLRFDTGVTSAGLAATEGLATTLDLRRGAAAWGALLGRFPSLGRQFREASAVRPFVHAPRVAHRVATVHGPRWALLPSAAGVIDPLLSTGFPLTLLGIARLAAILESTRPGAAREAALADYARDTVEELRVTERLVAALYASMADFALFKRLTMVYFAAASYAETVRRLGHPERARGFLLHADPVFGPALRQCAADAIALAGDGQGPGLPEVGARREALLDRIARTIDPFDVAGLSATDRRDWYPVRADDLYAARARVGASDAEIDALLLRTGFAIQKTAAR